MQKREGSKNVNVVKHQLERRQIAINRQRERRANLINALRSAQEDNKEEISMEVVEGNLLSKEQIEERKLTRRRSYACQLNNPEWLIDPPMDLLLCWYVLPRPEGIRCLVIANHGITISRTKNGSVLHRFRSDLPGGHIFVPGKDAGEDKCILDCIYCYNNKVYYILDVLEWKDNYYCEFETQFRFYWINTKYDELNLNVVSKTNEYKFSKIPVFDCDLNGLQQAYENKFEFTKDGLLFYYKKTNYECGCSPFVLVWKDPKCSMYFLDTNEKGIINDFISITLEVLDTGDLSTCDGYLIGKIDLELVRQNNIKPGDLVKFKINEINISPVNIYESTITNMTFLKKYNQTKIISDTWTKILFQYRARNNPITIDSIVEAMNNET